jgi:hypothetical protein
VLTQQYYYIGGNRTGPGVPSFVAADGGFLNDRPSLLPYAHW